MQEILISTNKYEKLTVLLEKLSLFLEK